ncbi:MAG: carbon-nitrogen hydrolase family protein [Candidatus Helarchaeota archaeon]
MKSIKVALVQFRMRPSMTQEKLLAQAADLIRRAWKEDAQIVCLPERWNYRRGELKDNIEPFNGKTLNYFRELAGELGIYLIGGAIWVHNEAKTENYIITGIFNPEGELIETQRKLHLYLFEKTLFKPGEEFRIIDTKLGKLGVAICFDMTFPEVARFFTLNDVDVLFSPVLIREEGIENWHIYLKARALENRMPICAVNCVGKFNDRNYPGQSLIIDFKSGYETPSKLNIREAPKNEEYVLIDTVDLATARKLREKRLAERIKFDIGFLGK